MKKAVGHLIPFMEKEREETKVVTGKIEDEASHFVGAWGPCEELALDTLTGLWGRDLSHWAWLPLKMKQRSETTFLPSIRIPWDFL